MLIFSIAILGLILGSFNNSVIYRLPLLQSLIAPSSHCPFCSHTLRVKELIPVASYIIQKGRCSHCNHDIPIRYIMVELLTCAGFVIIYSVVGFGWNLLSGLIFFDLVLIAAFIDIEKGIIPNRLNAVAIVIAILMAPLTIGWWECILGSLFLGSVFVLVAVLASGGLGGGDVKLSFVIGAFCGWPACILAFFISTVLASIYAGILILLGRADRKTAIKFGPFLAIGSIMAWLLFQSGAIWTIWM